MSKWLDQPAPVRPGEELDTQKLAAYLRSRLPMLTGELEIQQFPKGFSNLTYLLRFGDHEWVLRRPPFGANIKSAHDMSREYRILSHLIHVYPKVPKPLLYCDDPDIIGAPFYVMERVRGVILRPSLPADQAPSPELMARIADSFIATFAELHAVDYHAAGLHDLGRPQGYVRRQIEGWTERYHRAKTDDIPDMERTAQWLAENLRDESGASLIHNDFKYDNLVLHPEDWSRVVAVLDWEMATIGDPLMDLGTSLAYWLDPDDPPELQRLQLSPTVLPGNPTRAELVQRYAEKSGRDVRDVVFYYAYGLFKLAVIIQQIYYRYKQGFTQDARFAHLIHGVRGCAAMAAAAIHKQRIDRLF